MTKRRNGDGKPAPVWYRNELTLQVDVKLGWRDRLWLLVQPQLKQRLILQLSTKYAAGDFKGRVVALMAYHDKVRPLAKGAVVETQKGQKE